MKNMTIVSTKTDKKYEVINATKYPLQEERNLQLLKSIVIMNHILFALLIISGFLVWLLHVSSIVITCKLNSLNIVSTI